jgi:hypothetical protein
MTEVIPKKDFDKIRKQNGSIRESSKINAVNIKANSRGVSSLIEVDEHMNRYCRWVASILDGIVVECTFLLHFKCIQFVVQTVPKIMNQKTAIVE